MADHAFHYSPQDPRPTPEAIGRFQVVRRASAYGSQGAVYKAIDSRDGQEVAIKVLGNEFDSYDVSVLASLLAKEDSEELRREAAILAGLRHPNIVAVLESGEDPLHGPYVVMEWLADGDLRGRLDRADGRRLPVADALRIVGEILAGLSAAHALGIVHLDVKPGNILLADSGQAKLADFGIAGGPGALLGRGTPGYMAPEQQDPKRLDPLGPEADLYAVGVVLFEMLTGRVPALGEDPRTLRPEVPDWLSEAIVRALMPRPADRFSSAAEMAERLLGG